MSQTATSLLPKEPQRQGIGRGFPSPLTVLSGRSTEIDDGPFFCHYVHLTVSVSLLLQWFGLLKAVAQ